jgi:hypothetical protein
MTPARALGVSAVLAYVLACSSSTNGDGATGGGGGATGSGAAGGGAVTSAGNGAGASPSSGTGGTSSSGRAGNPSSGTGATGAGATGTGASGPIGTPTAACSGLPFEPADAGDAAASCAGITVEAESVDVDMYIMMDRSVSLADPVGSTGKIRWDLVREAVQAFVTDPAAANIGVGIQFFGQSGGRDDALDCDVSRYSTPAVAIGPASRVGSDLVAAVDAMEPGGLTPTMPALQGAIAYGKEWAMGHPGRATVVVLVTDGFPTQCQNPVSVSEIADVARQAYEQEPRVRTYTVGLAAGYNLDTIARAGGTSHAFLVDEGDVTRSFVSTLLNISMNSLACEYEIPVPDDTALTVNPEKVQVVYTPAVGDAEEVPRARSFADCASSSAGGWYYDDPSAPKKIIACPCTCSRFAAGKVEVRLGCYPRHVPIR